MWQSMRSVAQSSSPATQLEKRAKRMSQGEKGTPRELRLFRERGIRWITHPRHESFEPRLTQATIIPERPVIHGPLSLDFQEERDLGSDFEFIARPENLFLNFLAVDVRPPKSDIALNRIRHIFASDQRMMGSDRPA